MLSVLAVLGVLTFAAAQQQPNYTHQAVLEAGGNYSIRWVAGTNPTDYITIECTVRTQGWLGLGFSPNGGMEGADIVIAWIDQNGNPQISDRHGPTQGNGFPPPDDVQNYQLLSGMKNQTHIVVSFRRLLSTCDPNDWTITSDTTRMIWALNAQQVPTSAEDIQIHTDHGVISVHLLTNQTDNGLSQVIADPSVTTLDLGVTNVSISTNPTTLYWCKVIQLPVSTVKNIIATQMMIQPGNERYVHHLILYNCGNNDMTQYINNDGPCYSGTTVFAPMQLCNSLMGAWAVGGEPFVYPSNMGAPIFENNNQRFMLIEMHYNNVQMTPGLTDSSFFRMYITSNLRPIQTGRFGMGATVLPTEILIPPRQPQFTIYSYCPSSCTSRLQQPMNIFSGLLHTHLLGIAVKLRVIRKGVELMPVMKDDHYDFNYQNQIVLPTPLIILPGDDLIVECTYDTSSLTLPAYGGFPTAQEMCLTMFEYYPKRNLTSEGCGSLINAETMLKLLGAKAVSDAYNFNATVLNQNNQNKTVIDFYNTDVNWTNTTANTLQAFMKNPPQTITCGLQSSDPKIAANASNNVMQMTQAIPITSPYVAPVTTCATTSASSPAPNNNNNMYNTGATTSSPTPYNNNNMYNTGSTNNPNTNNNMYNTGNTNNPNNVNTNYNNDPNYGSSTISSTGNDINSAAVNLLDQLGRLVQWAVQQINQPQSS